MDNKYQEALDFLLTYPRIIETDGGVSFEKLANAKETMQKMIDSYQYQLEYTGMLENELFGGKGYAKLGKRISELEKALELACEYLEDGYGTDYVGRHPVFVGSRLDWQRYLMNLAWEEKRK